MRSISQSLLRFFSNSSVSEFDPVWGCSDARRDSTYAQLLYSVSRILLTCRGVKDGFSSKMENSSTGNCERLPRVELLSEPEFLSHYVHLAFEDRFTLRDYARQI